MFGRNGNNEVDNHEMTFGNSVKVFIDLGEPDGRASLAMILLQRGMNKPIALGFNETGKVEYVAIQPNP